MDDQRLQRDIQKLVKKRLSPLYKQYNFDPTELESILKWKPIVLILGNFSSGKSTLINELVGQEIQRTGQAPTDDSFTVITSDPNNFAAHSVPGATVIGDETLPFVPLKEFGEKLIAHFEMKLLDTPVLSDLAIIDSPGMLDSVTEKDRDYDYPGVVSELAKLADLVVLMFDPHKAGTIKETYDTIRKVLPDSAMEDRIVFVMNRIDECDNLGDLVRAYGTLCWNLSQMTGRKDIPRIFLTFSPEASSEPDVLGLWVDERKELKQKILAAPKLQISHILQDVDRQANELYLVIEAMTNFCQEGRKLIGKSLLTTTSIAILLFLFIDIICKQMFGFPETTFLPSLFSGAVPYHLMALPLVGLILPFLGMGIYSTKWLTPRYIRNTLSDPESLVNIDTSYREHLWSKTSEQVMELISRASSLDLLNQSHSRNLSRLDKFIDKDLQSFYEKIL